MTICSDQVKANISSYNETEVRFHILDPVIRKLGFVDNDQVYFKLEDKLSYPYYHIGHKSKNKDVPLGYPDYRAGLKGARGSFIAEAKAPSVSLKQEAIEQAHSYAAHAQVGANFFVLCNGKKILIFETLSGPEAMPIVKLSLEELDDNFFKIENILSPSNLAKNCATSYDVGLKLTDGLGSSSRIHSGTYQMSDWEYRILKDGNDITEFLRQSAPQLSYLDEQYSFLAENFDLRVGDGRVNRDQDGRITADVNFIGATKNNHQSMQMLGIDALSFTTKSEFISTNPESPTLFESNSNFSVIKGMSIAPILGDAVPAERDVQGDLLISAYLFKQNEMILGTYSSISENKFNIPMIGEIVMELDFRGPVSLKLNI